MFCFTKGGYDLKYLGVNEIRQMFLDFFSSKDHYSRMGFSLVPENDKSLLLINAGMAPMKNYFMGIEPPPNKRMATCQKCVRTGDIDNVGKTARHATFFEMLGNFSFGDYFKKDAIAWAWEFVTEDLGLNPDDLWVTVYLDDDEAFEIWERDINVPKERIIRLGKEDNFWEIGTGTGPCGPCSEIYIDRGKQYACSDPDCKPGCDCDRFLEFWNLVFTQFNKEEDGTYTPLPNPNIDTGMGLERMACIMQNVDSIFDIDTMKSIRDKVCSLSGKEYGASAKDDISIRLITDHSKAATFLISDGVLPSNEGRGYVLRRLIRRAARHGRLLGIKDNFLVSLMETVIDNYSVSYKELLDQKEYIRKVLTVEEEKFAETVDQGIIILKEYIDKIKSENKDVLSGEDAFRLYDTYGFPIELTLEIVEEYGLKVDEDGFKVEMQKQKERARSARTDKDSEGWKEASGTITFSVEKSEFLGYDKLQTLAKIKDIVFENEKVQTLSEGQIGELVFDKTPFYAESGGQVADKGSIKGQSFIAKVKDVQKSHGELFIHRVEVLSGEAKLSDECELTVDEKVRKSTQRNHTGTHLLHKALREVLGAHIHQAGSLVTDTRLRFDFTHFEPITAEEISRIETMVNEAIFKAYPVKVEVMKLEDAKKSGAIALFDEKYEDNVRVVSVGDFSTELCGGTHVSNSSDIGMFKIISESGIASGVRRIEAITGSSVYQHFLEKEAVLYEIKSLVKANEENLVAKLSQTIEDYKAVQKELSKLKAELAKNQINEILDKAKDIDGIKYIYSSFEGLDDETLRNAAENVIDKIENSVVLLSSNLDAKISFVCMVSKIAQQKGVHAGKFIKEVSSLTGGGGGGKPNMAQAGGKDISKLSEAMKKSEEILKTFIK